jgi:UDP-N-acetylmuramate dehydrogenase
MEFKSNVSLAHYTTFKIGGPAKLFADVSDASELSLGYERASAENLPVYIMAGGSNILFSDNGFPGVVMRLTDGGFRILDNGRVSVGAGKTLLDVILACCQAGLSGMEKLAGVPGSVGGAVRGNAGAFGSEMADCVVSVKALNRNTGMVKEFGKKECLFGYRMSCFKMRPELVILSVELRLVTGGDPAKLTAIVSETQATREAKHPQDAFCAGSFFMNPVIDDEHLREEFRHDSGKEPRGERLPAGWVIDHVGLRGKTIGNAKVSELHPNYIVNTGGATAEEVLTLVSIVKQRVRDELNVQLQEEVQMVGFGHEELKKRRDKASDDFSWPS